MRLVVVLVSASKYTSQLLPRLAELNADASLIGFYTSSNNGQHLAMGGFVEALLGAQVSGGGIGSGLAKATPVGRAATSATAGKNNLAASAQQNKSGKGIALVYGESLVLTFAQSTRGGR